MTTVYVPGTEEQDTKKIIMSLHQIGPRLETAEDDIDALEAVTHREVLTAARTYYVRTDGSNSNTGLANSSGGAFLTIQKAIDVVAALDISTYAVTITVVAGTYTGTVVVTGPWVGSGTVTLNGDTTTPSNVVISVTSADAVVLNNAARLSIQGFKLTGATSGFALLYSKSGSALTLSGKNEFGSAPAHQIVAEGGYVYASNPEILSGTIAGGHYFALNNGFIYCQSATWTSSGTWTGGGFAQAITGGVIYAFSNTSSGTFVGQRYNASMNGAIQSNGGGANYFPGDSAGATATGGQYA